MVLANTWAWPAGASLVQIMSPVMGSPIGRLLIRPCVLVLAKRWGLKPLVIAGTVATGLQYPLLAEVRKRTGR